MSFLIIAAGLGILLLLLVVVGLVVMIGKKEQ